MVSISRLFTKKKKTEILQILQIFPLVYLLLFVIAQIPANASSFQFSSESIIGLFERENEEGDALQVVPLYDYLHFDYGDVEAQPISLHLHGWVRTDAGDGNYYEDDTDGELLYGYLEYVSPGDAMNLKLGRQHIFSGIINDSLDGIGVTGHLGPYLSFSACGGYPVAYQEENGTSGDGALGGRIALHPTLSNEIGFSYKNISDDNRTAENTAGLDISLGLFHDGSVNGRSSWNFETSGWKEHAYETSITFSPFYFKPFFQYVQYEDYFPGETTHIQPFRFLENTKEKLTIMGLDMIWQAFYKLDLGTKFKHYDYDLRSETSRYAAALINVYGESETVSGIEAGMMDGDTEENRYRLFRGYFFWDTPASFFEKWFISGDMIFVLYEKEIYGKDHSFFVSMGTGKQLWKDNLQIEMSGSYSIDPYFDSDLRTMMVVTLELK